MNYIVFDLEWNQSPEGKERSDRYLPFEIVEIGAVKLDQNRKPIGEFRRLVKPQVYEELHFKIQEVTGLEMELLLREGQPFEQVIREFLEWCGPEEYRFCSWGPMDLTELERNIAYYGMEIPFERPLLYYDIQKLYSLEYGDGKSRAALDQAVCEQDLADEGGFHRAFNDALYTAEIFGKIDMEWFGPYVSVDYYQLPESGKSYRLSFPEYSKFVSAEFETKEELIKNKEVSDLVCIKCRRMLRKKIRWFSYGQRFYFAMGICPEHGYMKGKIRVKKSERELYYGVKTVKAASEEDLELLVQKREDNKRKRKSLPKK